MIQKIQKLKRRGGFTLVELIVVLVILAVLAALLVPALTGYIDEAKNRQYIGCARYAFMATQTVLDEMFAEGVPATNIKNDDYKKEVQALIDSTGLNSAHIMFCVGEGIFYDENGNVSYTADATNCKEPYTIIAACYIYQINEGGNYHLIYYDGSSWTESKEQYKKLGSRNPPTYAMGAARSMLMKGASSQEVWVKTIKDIQ